MVACCLVVRTRVHLAFCCSCPVNGSRLSSGTFPTQVGRILRCTMLSTERGLYCLSVLAPDDGTAPASHFHGSGLSRPSATSSRHCFEGLLKLRMRHILLLTIQNGPCSHSHMSASCKNCCKSDARTQAVWESSIQTSRRPITTTR